MPGVFNVGNSYNTNNKRISSKLTFDSGEKFSGKIIKKDDKNEVTIKLIDGWEFSAQIDGDIEGLENGLQRFQVEGFVDGKLKLKVIAKNIKGDELAQGEFNDIISSSGLSKEDVVLLKSMLKFDIPLTKENIREIKGLIQFLDKIQANPKEIDEFISKYLMGKGIPQNSEEGIKINNVLKEFLGEFKTLSYEDILLFIENDMEFNKENIKGYNNLFKGKENLIKVLDNISNSIPELNDFSKKNMLENNLKQSIKGLDTSTIIPKSIDVDGQNIEEQRISKISQYINGQETSINNKLANDVYQKSDTGNSKVSILSLLKSISGKSEDLLNTSLKEILTNRRMEFTSSEFDRVFNLINTMKPEELINKLKETISEFNEIGAKNIVDDFSDYLNKTNNETLGVKEALDFSKGQLEKVLSSVMGKGITLTEEEFLKLKDVINLKNQGIIDNEVSQDQIGNDLAKDILTKDSIIGLNSNNIDKNINENNIINKNLTTSIPTKELVEASLNKGAEGSKEIIKDLISNLKSESLISEKILDIIKNNISDIKVFNKISSEYYYADIPVNIREREYPCKIIVKDNRKEGKKIDSTNVKMVVTVETKNLGTVDGYMQVLDKKINIELKCEEKFVKMIDMTKSKLVNNIENMGFLVNVKVSKKENEVSLTTCRDFFSSNAGISLDRRV
jgi:ribosomal protein L17